MIYFLQKPDGGNIKIGTTVCLSKRKVDLEREHGPLTLRGVMSGGYLEETELHRLFSGVRVEGEWFAPHVALVGFIVEKAEPWNGEDELRMTSIRLDARTAERIKKASTLKSLTIAEYIRKFFLPVVDRHLKEEGRKLAEETDPA